MAVKTLTLTMIVKTKPGSNPYKQIPDEMEEKRFKAEKGKVIISRMFLWGCKADSFF